MMRMPRNCALLCLFAVLTATTSWADDGRADLDKAISLKLTAKKLNELAEVADFV